MKDTGKESLDYGPTCYGVLELEPSEKKLNRVRAFLSILRLKSAAVCDHCTVLIDVCDYLTQQQNSTKLLASCDNILTIAALAIILGAAVARWLRSTVGGTPVFGR